MKHLLSLFLMTSALWAYTPDKEYKITVLHTNDHHGRFMKNDHGEYGLAARATLIKNLREQLSQEGRRVFLVDAGDVNTGLAHSNIFNAEPDFKGMALIGYDLMAVGNHEFDNPMDVLQQQMMWAGFPFLSANIYYPNGTRVFQPTTDFMVDDLKVTFLGMTTDDTPIKSNPLYTNDYEFKSPVEEAKTIVPELKQNTDVLIAVTHMGHYQNGEHGADAPGDVSMARAVEGLDLIVGGHSNSQLETADLVNGTYIVQAGNWGKYVGRVDLVFKNGDITLENYELIPVNLRVETQSVEGEVILTPPSNPIPEDIEMLDLITPFIEVGNQRLQEEIINLVGNLNGERAIVRTQETNLGNLLNRANQSHTQADIVITNSGGIRASINEGAITSGDVLTVLPFGNFYGYCEMSGAELKGYLNHVLTQTTPGSGSFPQTLGVQAFVNTSSNEVTALMVNEQPIVDTTTYRVGLSDFIANGGDGYPHCNFTSVIMDSEGLRSYLLELAKETSEINANSYNASTGIIRYTSESASYYLYLEVEPGENEEVYYNQIDELLNYGFDIITKENRWGEYQIAAYSRLVTSETSGPIFDLHELEISINQNKVCVEGYKYDGNYRSCAGMIPGQITSLDFYFSDGQMFSISGDLNIIPLK